MTAITSDPSAFDVSGSNSATVLVQQHISEWSLSDLYERLEQFGQTHLLSFWDELTLDQRDELATQIEAIDFQLVQELYERQSSAAASEASSYENVSAPPAKRLDTQDVARDAQASAIGEALLAAGTVGVTIVAGGQGSRLGFEHPKGMYPIGPVSDATIFQILFEKVQALASQYQVRIPLYLMTSPATHSETVAFLVKNDHFGMDPDDVTVFCQGTMPAVDADGKLLLESKGKIFASPDGHGGMLQALDRSQALADMRNRGIEHLFYLQVDNPLCEIVSPTFLGYHVLANSEVTTQVVTKHNPTDKVGNVVSVDGKLQIIEYSDLPTELGERQNTDGTLELWAGNTAIHCFSVAFLEQVVSGAIEMPFHYASKKVPFVDNDGNDVSPTESNATKFEKFIFDLLPAARRAFVVEVDPELMFAPVKNAPGSGADSPEAVRDQMVRLHRSWLADAGVSVADGVQVEISPLFANDANQLAARAAEIGEITSDSYLR